MILYCSVIIIASIMIILFNYLFGGENLLIITSLTTLSVVVEILIDALIALIVSRQKDKKFNINKKLYNISKEKRSFYEKLGIKKWKDKIAELGVLNHFRKNKIYKPDDNNYLEKFIIESAKGILIHALSCFIGFIVIFILPIKYWLQIGVYVAIVNLILNLLPIMVLQYNICKIKIMIDYNKRHMLKNKNE